MFSVIHIRQSISTGKKESRVIGKCEHNHVRRPTHALRNVTQRFFGNDDGNIAIMFGITSFMMFVLTGFAVDFARYNMVRSDMLNAMDAAGLAMAQYAELRNDTSEDQLKAFGRKVFYENFNYENVVNNLNIDFSLSSATITPTVTGEMDAIILSDLTIGSNSISMRDFDMNSETEITRRGAGRIELALVLDVTGSMDDPAVVGGSGKKITDLKGSVDIMLNSMFGDATTDENIKIAVVPFNSYVNVGGGTTSFADEWTDNNAEAHYHGYRFIHAQTPTEIDTSDDAKITNSDDDENSSEGSFHQNATGLAKVFDPDRKVNHLDLFNSVSTSSWLGCVEDRPYPLDEVDIPSGDSTTAAQFTSILSYQPITGTNLSAQEIKIKSAFDNTPIMTVNATDAGTVASSKFVPLFLPDEPNCDFTNVCWDVTFPGNDERLGPFTLDGLRRSVYVHENWLTTPQDAGDSYWDYPNRTFVDDDDFSVPAYTFNFFYYGEFMLGFRHSRRLSHTSGSYWGKLADRFEQIGATDEDIHEHIARTAYVGVYDSANKRYTNRYANTVVTVDEDPSDDTTLGPNQLCPQDAILPLSDNKTTIRNKVQALVPHGATNTAVGAMWGYRVLSPSAPFTEGAEYSDKKWRKAVVIMTDGENDILTRDSHWGSTGTAYGFASEERMGAGIDTADEMETEMDNKMLRICQRMKDDGILVYTVMFGLNSTRVEDLFKACATAPESPFFHDASTSTDLDRAFADIANDLVDLHISR